MFPSWLPPLIIASSRRRRVLPVAGFESRIRWRVGADDPPKQARVELRLRPRSRLAICSAEFRGVPDGDDLTRKRSQRLVFHNSPFHLKKEMIIMGDRGKAREQIRHLRRIFRPQSTQV